MAVSAYHPFTWQVGELLPTVRTLYDPSAANQATRRDAWYPTDPGTLAIPVWFAVVKTAPRQTRVIVATGFDLRAIRMMTLELALASINEIGRATPEDEATLNQLTEKIKV